MSTNKGSRRRKRKADGDVLAVIGWFWRDWRASTARAAMSPLARGVYRELLDAHWGEKDCSLPDDDRMLAALAGVTPAEWASVREEVLPWLPINAKGRRQNHRALAAWKEALAFRKEKREAGKHGAAKRWHSHGRPIGEPMANDSPPPHSSASLLLHTYPDPESARAGPGPGPDPSPVPERGYATTAAPTPVEPKAPVPQAPGAGRSRPDRLPPTPQEPQSGPEEASSAAAHRLELAIGCGFQAAMKAVQGLVVAGADLPWIEARIARSTGTTQRPWDWAAAAKAALAQTSASTAPKAAEPCAACQRDGPPAGHPERLQAHCWPEGTPGVPPHAQAPISEPLCVPHRDLTLPSRRLRVV